MHCARTLIIVMFATVCLVVPTVMAQDSADSKIQISDSEKVESKNAELKSIPKMSEVSKQPIYWMCKSKADVRTIRVEAEKGQCTSKYSKEGTERVVSQSSAIRSCFQVFANIRRNLENASYKCRDISTSRISTAE